ncbi:aspartate:alanine exchanger family transporter [Micrococcus yunnanensis]|uniref:aspartate:alanine exchanger family transporter n=1 Tax=Micrococcus yunnanensis TaxID=566027 RepID=UPI00178AD614|nr:TrkA C-terminal domain-containing protein [Micrococcus yunnanensis]MBE1539467.1 putative transport protein [Micrococcus yunnanensis]
MLALLNDQPILVLMATVALGAAVGTIPLGKIRLGASGALFVGLLVGAVLPDVGDRLALFQSFGLALFAYLIGLGAGKVFFRDLRRNLPLMLAAVVVVILTAFTVHPLAALLHLDLPTAIGVWTGSLTATPAMALANQLTGGQAPAVGYGLSYLVGVVGTIIAITLLAARPWSSSPRDPAPVTDGKLRFTAAAATSALAVRDIPGISEGLVRVVALRHGGMARIAGSADRIEPGDEVVLDGTEKNIDEAVQAFGRRTDADPARVMNPLQTSMVIVTARALADRRLGTLSLRERFGTDVARLRRDDVESLATPQTELKVGDRVLIVTTAPRMEAVRDFFGNSTRGLSNLDWISLGTGMALGYLLGLVTIPLPGGASFSLGPAAGCILVGLALGAIGRTGPTVWEPSTEIALTLRQFGLMLFLGVVGLAAGPAFIETVFTRVGGLAILMSAVLTALTAALLIAAARLLGQSVDRTYGALAGITGQPAILDYALSRSTDARVTEGYAQLFALIMVVKIATVPFML